MRSISKHIDEYDIAQEIRIERKLHGGAFLLLEGVSDIKRFDRFVDQHNCVFINCYGRDNAIGAIEILYEEGFPGAVAVVDADFDRILGGTADHEGLVYSEGHDLDLDWATDDLLRRYLVEYADVAKVAVCGGEAQIVQSLLEALKPVSAARLLNKRGAILSSLKRVDVSACLTGFSVDVVAFVSCIPARPPLSVEQRRHLVSQINNVAKLKYDLKQLTNGHDFCCALGVALRSELGSRKVVHTWGSEIEAHFRLLMSDNEFRATKVANDLVQWQRDNAPYQVLDYRFP